MTTIMKNFTVKDSNGKAVRFGTCTSDTFSAQAMNPGETVVEGLPPESPPRPAFDPTYQYLRMTNYPPIGTQLDALYHAMNAGLIPIVPAFYDPIKAVKEQFPKT